MDDIRLLLEGMKRQALPFVLTLDSVSSCGFQMLDVDACVTDDRSLSFRLYQKPSSIWRPLSPESQHPHSIHLHWPIAQCRRIMKRHTSTKEGEEAVRRFKALYSHAFGRPIAERHKNSRPKLASSWIVLPYHVCLVAVRLSQVVSSLVVPVSLSFDRVRLSWSLCGKHLVHRLRRSNIEMSQ